MKNSTMGLIFLLFLLLGIGMGYSYKTIQDARLEAKVIYYKAQMTDFCNLLRLMDEKDQFYQLYPCEKFIFADDINK